MPARISDQVEDTVVNDQRASHVLFNFPLIVNEDT